LGENKSKVKKIATARIIFTGKKALIDYNWSVKQVQASNSIKESPQFLIQVELILINEKGANETNILEFSQEEFTVFVKKLDSTLK
jgi:hypothetical protein